MRMKVTYMIPIEQPTLTDGPDPRSAYQHGGGAGRFDRLKETALVYAFVLHVFGLE